MYFDVSILSNLFSIDILWKIVLWFYKTFRSQSLKSAKGNQVFIWGSNRFIGCPNVLVVNDEPNIKVDVLKNRLYLSANLYDRDGKLAMKIIRNRIKLNKNNIFEIQQWSKNRIKITNQFNEPIEIIAHKTGEIELNGVFYCGGNRFEASPNGLQIN